MRREAVNYFSIPSLQTAETYYIVDPSNTKKSCCPEVDFLPKTIIVSSPDSRHWGGSAFGKRRENTYGQFMFFPIWTLKELLNARPELGEHLTEDEVCERYRYFGGVSRHVFTKHNIENNLFAQDIAIRGLTPEQAKKVALHDMDAVGTLNENWRPRSKSFIFVEACRKTRGYMSLRLEKTISFTSMCIQKQWTISRSLVCKQRIRTILSILATPRIAAALWQSFCPRQSSYRLPIQVIGAAANLGNGGKILMVSLCFSLYGH
jgi:hypothetical protein